MPGMLLLAMVWDECAVQQEILVVWQVGITTAFRSCFVVFAWFATKAAVAHETHNDLGGFQIAKKVATRPDVVSEASAAPWKWSQRLDFENGGA